MSVRKKQHRCVSCGFNSSQGHCYPTAVGYRKSFVCSSCEEENIRDQERQHDDAEFAESERQECRAVRRF